MVVLVDGGEWRWLVGWGFSMVSDMTSEDICINTYIHISSHLSRILLLIPLLQCGAAQTRCKYAGSMSRYYHTTHSMYPFQ